MGGLPTQALLERRRLRLKETATEGKRERIRARKTEREAEGETRTEAREGNEMHTQTGTSTSYADLPAIRASNPPLVPSLPRNGLSGRVPCHEAGSASKAL